jgi:hypothetical protein
METVAKDAAPFAVVSTAGKGAPKNRMERQGTCLFPENKFKDYLPGVDLHL